MTSEMHPCIEESLSEVIEMLGGYFMSKIQRKNIEKFCAVNESFKDYLDFIRDSREEKEHEILDNMKKHLDNITLLLRKMK